MKIAEIKTYVVANPPLSWGRILCLLETDHG